MTLFKQIAILVTVVILLLAGAYLLNDVRKTERFLQGQMQTTAADMATVLGIVISNMPDGAEPASLEVLFNSVFDSGYYSEIALIGIDGQVIHNKTQQLSIAGVPGWFLNWVDLQPVQGTSQVMQGWSQLGQLQLTLHPGFAYDSLYQSLLNTVKWFVLIFVGAMLLLWLLLHALLRPLKQVMKQANAIQNSQFVLQNRIPNTLELKHVVEAMNQMVSKVQSVFEDQQTTLARYQDLLYRDKLTGLGNRAYLMNQLQQALAEDSSFHGCLAMVKLVNFTQVRETQGYQVSDKILFHLRDVLSQLEQGAGSIKQARLGDDEFAVLIESDEDSAFERLQQLFDSLKQDQSYLELAEECYPVAGIANLETGLQVSEVLSNVDYCLTRSQSAGPYHIDVRKGSDISLPQGKIQWRQWLEDALTRNRLFLVGQVALDEKENVVQREVFVRCRNEQGQVVPASIFMPMAASLGLAVEIDYAVFDLVKKRAGSLSASPLAVNLSAAFFEEADALSELESLLEEGQASGLQICVEASHHILAQHEDMSSRISQKVKLHGHRFGIDNIDLGQSLNLIQSGLYDYIKINASNLAAKADDDAKAGSEGFQALNTMTRTYDVDLIVVGIDSKQTFAQFASMGVRIMQGNLLGKPEAIA